MDNEKLKEQRRLPGQQLVSALEEREHVTCPQSKDEIIPQNSEVKSITCRRGMLRKPFKQSVLAASPVGRISPLPTHVLNSIRGSIKVSVPKRATVHLALQMLSTTVTDQISAFVHSCKSGIESTYHTLQQSSINIENSLACLNRTTLHLCTVAKLEQVANALNMELSCQSKAINSLSHNVGAAWTDLHKQMSAFVSDLVANLHEKAYLSVDAIHSEVASHLLKFNIAVLANKRVTDGLVAGFRTLNIKASKRTSNMLQAAQSDWMWLVAKHKIRTFADEIRHPRFMRHAKFVPTVSRLQKMQQHYADMVMEGMAKSMLPSALHSKEHAQRAYNLMQDIYVAWKDEIKTGVNELWEQHASQLRGSHLKGKSVQSWCVEHTEFTLNDVLSMFKAECGDILEDEGERESSLIKLISTEMCRQHEIWNGMIKNFWLKLTNRISVTLDEQLQRFQRYFLSSQSAFSELQVKHHQTAEVQELQHQEYLKQISIAPSEDALEELHAAASHHLDMMLQGYYSSHQILLKALDEQGTGLMSIHNKHESIICEILGILPTCANNFLWDEELKQGENEAHGTQPTVPGGPGELVSNGQTRTVESIGTADSQLPPYSICNIHFARQEDLVSKLIAMPSEHVTGDADASCAQHQGQGETDDGSIKHRATSDDPDDLHDPFTPGDPGGPVVSGDRDLLRDFNITMPEAALRTSVDALIHQVLEDLINRQNQAADSFEVWKMQSAANSTARLNKLIQNHRPKRGMLDEDWCGNRRRELRGQNSQLAQFLQTHVMGMESQVEEFERNVQVAIASSEENLAKLKGITDEFQTACSMARVDICERNMIAKFNAAKHNISEAFRTVRDHAVAALDGVITRVQGFLGDALPASDESVVRKNRAAYDPQKLHAFVSSVQEVKQKQLSVIETKTSELLSNTCTAYSKMQSCLSKYRVDAEFVECVEKIKEDANRSFRNILETSQNCSIEVDQFLNKLLSYTVTVKIETSACARAAESCNALLTIADCLQRCLLLRSTELEILKSPTAVFNRSSALFLWSSTDPFKPHDKITDIPPAYDRDSEVQHPLPVRKRADAILDSARTALQTAASKYYNHVDNTTSSNRNDIPTNEQDFMEQQEKMLAKLSHLCDQHINVERATYRKQVLSAYNALHAVPEALCNAHVVFGVKRIRQTLEMNEKQFKQSILNLESRRQVHQLEVSRLLMTDVTTLLKTLDQKEQNRHSCICKVNDETTLAMHSSLQACMNEIFQAMERMCLSVSDLLSSWVLPTDLIIDECGDTDHSTLASPFEYLALLQSIIDSSEAENLDSIVGRAVSKVRWKTSVPRVSVADPTGLHSGTPENAAVEGRTIVSLNTAPHWLLMYAQKQASARLIEHGVLQYNSIVSVVNQEQKREIAWRKQWNQMLHDVHTRKYA